MANEQGIPERFYCRFGQFHPVPRLALECTIHNPEQREAP